ncbi:MAG: hypothetical protein JST54_31875 [Deltaproteobacteria bacterium]|nr:hypothetical protein [Deltaproteobacteria bacterium]
MKTLSLVAALSLFGATAHADHPCKRVEAACAAAGFVKGGAKLGKGLAKNCMEPLFAGVQVPGVVVAPADVQACAAKKAAKHLPPPAPPPTNSFPQAQ